MSNIPGVRNLIAWLTQFFTWVTYPTRAPGDTIQFFPTPIKQFADFVVDYPVVLIFVVVVPLVGLGISLLRRMLNS